MTIQLQTWSERSFTLKPAQAAGLRQTGLVNVLLDEPPERWRLVAASRVGVARLDDGLELRVSPRLSIPQLMFLLSYAHDEAGWRDTGPAYEQEEDLFTAIAAAFTAYSKRALTPAPLRGYVVVEESSLTLRGRVRIGDQLARWPGRYLPLEISYDDYSIDIPENRLIRGAAELLLSMPIRSRGTRRGLLQIRGELEGVSIVKPAREISTPPITRLNSHYRRALALAALILRSCSISTRPGEIAGVSFVFDMNAVFEDFLSAALRDVLQRYGGLLIAQGRAGYLDEERRIGLIPDLVWCGRHGARAVIDAKYKRLYDKRFPNADAYQMLAYCTALRLDRGYLVYAKDASERARDHTIVNSGKIIHVRAVDVEAPAELVLAQIAELAEAIAGTSLRPATAVAAAS